MSLFNCFYPSFGIIKAFTEWKKPNYGNSEGFDVRKTVFQHSLTQEVYISKFIFSQLMAMM